MHADKRTLHYLRHELMSRRAWPTYNKSFTLYEKSIKFTHADASHGLESRASMKISRNRFFNSRILNVVSLAEVSQGKTSASFAKRRFHYDFDFYTANRVIRLFFYTIRLTGK
jgi:hypothetical protein